MNNLQTLPAQTPRTNCVEEESPLTPELREFIDHTIVPILVKEYLAVNDRNNELAKKDSTAAHSVSNTAARELRAVKP